MGNVGTKCMDFFLKKGHMSGSAVHNESNSVTGVQHTSGLLFKT